MTGKTHSQYVTFTYNSNDISASVASVNGIGISYIQEDITVLDSALNEFMHGRGDLNITISGPFNSAANEAHATVEALNGDTSGATLTIAIGDQAAPTTGDPEFECSNVGTFDYMVSATGGRVEFSATLRPLDGATAAWGTVSA